MCTVITKQEHSTHRTEYTSVVF